MGQLPLITQSWTAVTGEDAAGAACIRHRPTRCEDMHDTSQPGEHSNYSCRIQSSAVTKTLVRLSVAFQIVASVLGRLLTLANTSAET